MNHLKKALTLIAAASLASLTPTGAFAASVAVTKASGCGLSLWCHICASVAGLCDE